MTAPSRKPAQRAHRIAGAARAYKKVSVTLPADLLDEIRAEVGPGNLSRYVAETLEEKRRQAALSEFLAHHERMYGLIPDEAVQEVFDEWDATLRQAEEDSSPGSSSTATG